MLFYFLFRWGDECFEKIRKFIKILFLVVVGLVGFRVFVFYY